MTFARLVADALESSWPKIARPNQLPPPGDWSIWLLLAGRGFGKTRVLSEWTNAQAISGRFRRIALVAATAADGRDILVEGESGILACAPNWARPLYEPSRRRLIWPGGAIGTLYSAEEPERLRGPQHDAAICDELGSWPHETQTWDMLQFGLRLGTHPRVVVATTPRPTKLIRALIDHPDCVVTRGSSYENRANLAPGFFEQIVRKYEGTRLGRQELEAELLEDVPGALWGRDLIEQSRRERAPVELTRVVVAIDPAATSTEESDETGIIVVGRDEVGHGYVLADLSGRYAPAAWARVAINAYHAHRADRVVAETNNGGEMVEATIRMVDPNVAFSKIHASRGKFVRAEPIAALYEQQRIHHIGSFPALEDEMCVFIPGDGNALDDRVDAIVYACSELLVEQAPGQAIYDYYRMLNAEAEARRSSPASGIPPIKPQDFSRVVYAIGSMEWQAQEARRRAAAEAADDPWLPPAA